MPLSPRDLKIIGSAAAVLVFGGPLAALYFSMSGWGEGLKDSDLHPERARQAPATPAAAPAAARPSPVAPTTDRGRSVPSAEVTAGAVGALARRASAASVEVTFRNVSDRKLRLAVPGRAGTLVTIVPDGGTGAPRTGPVYDDERDGVVELLSGDRYSRTFSAGAPLPPGAFRVVYDSRGEGLPAGVWAGRIEIPVARGLEAGGRGR